MITNLRLKNFRNYHDLSIKFDKNFVVFFGENGCGKTNIMEAISLFSQGKGIRKANFTELQNKDNLNSWSINIDIDGYNIGTGIKTLESKKREWFLNQEPFKSSKTLHDILRIFWLTPQTDRLFLDSPSVRRSFLDQMSSIIYPIHAIELKSYENNIKQRNKILELKQDKKWLDIVEDSIAKSAIMIRKNRNNLINIFNNSNFLSAKMTGEAEDLIKYNNQDEYKEKLKINRIKDEITGITSFGIHRSDLKVNYLNKDNEADFCSTGEQKMLVFEMVFIFLQNIFNNCFEELNIILLFDDVVSHLDVNNRNIILIKLKELIDTSSQNGNKMQVFFSATEQHFFKAIDDCANFINVESLSIR